MESAGGTDRSATNRNDVIEELNEEHSPEEEQHHFQKLDVHDQIMDVLNDIESSSVNTESNDRIVE